VLPLGFLGIQRWTRFRTQCPAGVFYFPNISAVSRRDNVHLLYLDPDNNICASVAIRITSKHDEFTLRSNRPSGSQRAMTQAQGISNPLIDVHGDIWDKFPVEAAIQRSVSRKSICSTRCLTFVSLQQADLFKNRFAHLIRAFKRASGKPTGDYFTDGNYIVELSRPSTHSTMVFLSQCSQLAIGC
jgi:hypothetical protein